MRFCSIIIPTLNEEKNIPLLLDSIERVSQEHALIPEIIIVDDHSTDRTCDVIGNYRGSLAVTLISRDNGRGLAGAVVTGAKAAQNEFVVVMDADLSHPATAIPQLLLPLEQGTADLVIGSRYVSGASLPHWPLRRKLASRLASLPAQLLTGARDPLAGFFATKKRNFEHLDNHLPGFKIGFELLMTQVAPDRFLEVPIAFHDRSEGYSKMNGTVIKAYANQLCRLCGLHVPAPLRPQAIVLGILALLVDMLLLRLLSRSGFSVSTAHAISFFFVLHCSYFLLALPEKRDGTVNWPPSYHLQSYGAVLAVMLAMFFLRGGFLATALNNVPLSHPLVFSVQVASVAATWLMMLLVVSPDSILRYNAQRRQVWFLLVIGYSLLLRVAYLGAAELIQEEAYYWNYAQHLDYGYLDHPPMVALLIRFGLLFFGDSEIGVRLAALLCWCGTAWFSWRYSTSLFGRKRALDTLLLISVLPIFFGTGLVMTPDAPLVTCWAASIFFLYKALVEGNTRSWIGAGIFLGLGLVSKYTIALLGPAVICYMLFEPRARKWFFSPYPYLAALIALVIFSPVIYWNIEHGWTSFLFQTHNRLVASTEFSLHELIASVVVLLTPIGLWALLLHLRPSKLAQLKQNWGGEQGGQSVHFLLVMAIVPLSVFVFFSLFKEIKLIWTGPIWITLLPLISIDSVKNCFAATTRSHPTFKTWAVTATLLLFIYGTALHYCSLGLPGIPYPRQTTLIGWPNLALLVAQKANSLQEESGVQPIIVGMDRYRIVSGLTFYQSKVFGLHGEKKAQILEATTGRHLFGIDALMYGFWSAPEHYRNRTVLVLSPDKGELIKERFRPYASEIGELGTFYYGKFGTKIGAMHYRLLKGYHPIRNEVALR